MNPCILCCDDMFVIKTPGERNFTDNTQSTAIKLFFLFYFVSHLLPHVKISTLKLTNTSVVAAFLADQ